MLGPKRKPIKPTPQVKLKVKSQNAQSPHHSSVTVTPSVAEPCSLQDLATFFPQDLDAPRTGKPSKAIASLILSGIEFRIQLSEEQVQNETSCPSPSRFGQDTGELGGMDLLAPACHTLQSFQLKIPQASILVI